MTLAANDICDYLDTSVYHSFQRSLSFFKILRYGQEIQKNTVEIIILALTKGISQIFLSLGRKKELWGTIFSLGVRPWLHKPILAPFFLPPLQKPFTRCPLFQP